MLPNSTYVIRNGHKESLLKPGHFEQSFFRPDGTWSGLRYTVYGWSVPNVGGAARPLGYTDADGAHGSEMMSVWVSNHLRTPVSMDANRVDIDGG